MVDGSGYGGCAYHDQSPEEVTDASVDSGTVLVGLVVAAAASAQEWRYYGGDAGGTRYSSLDQINKNVVTAPNRLIALQAETGEELWDVDPPIDHKMRESVPEARTGKS